MRVPKTKLGQDPLCSLILGPFMKIQHDGDVDITVKLLRKSEEKPGEIIESKAQFCYSLFVNVIAMATIYN